MQSGQINPGNAMKLKQWHVDAFATRVFQGNPAAVVLLENWLRDDQMQAIARENNLSDTAFFVGRDEAAYDLRWFTPSMEVPLCGHATLASAWVIFSELAPHLDAVQFSTKSGDLVVENSPDGCHRMALPAGRTEPFPAPREIAAALAEALRAPAPEEVYFAPNGAGGTPGILALWRESALRELQPFSLAPLLESVKSGALLATARAESPAYDFVSRFFAPGMGVTEDPVTGSMHATLAPFWAKRLNMTTLLAFQASPRGGEVHCQIADAHVILSGPCTLYMRGEIDI